ncbi:type IV secretion system protein [Phenylobacterium montanum]|uniref:Type IV secretion system protein n=1 Tax=Phenylobacterium montanum TaxID=2823693 RepID=A0A975G3C4_9CAUL|nr:type IV secretion system protein [Caulobacter sp. S6]QUD89812.1 type IV secretion system protein [Caulobacter sp. S6]
MSSACAVPAADAPLVRSLLSQSDCHVRELVHSGYASLFQGSGGLAPALTTLMTLFVALIGYQLMLGRMELRVGEVTLAAIKLAAVTAFASQWDNYQALVFTSLFDGPAQIATAMLRSIGDNPGDIFDGLQAAIDALTAASAAYSQHAGLAAAVLVGGGGFASTALTAAAGLLLLSSLGVVLAAKIVLGVLLAVGPIFIALALFDATRGLFEGWLRAALGFAFAPLSAMLLLAVILSILEPNLTQLAELRAKGDFSLAPVYSILTLSIVFAAVTAGSIAASAIVFGGFRLPAKAWPGRSPAPAAPAVQRAQADPAASRSTRLAAVVSAQVRREQIFVSDRHATAGASSTIGGIGAASAAGRGAAPAPFAEPRLGQAPRRRAAPRTSGPRRAN